MSTTTSLTFQQSVLSRPAASDVVGSLEAISLEELSAAAGLLTRVDRKYLVPREVVGELVAGLPGARALQIGGRRALAYASTYADTTDLACFYAAAHRRRRRFKVRTRSYLDTATAFLEVKTRGGRGHNVKDRMPINPERVMTLDGQERAFVAGLLAARGVAEPGRADEVAARLRPVLRTTYERMTLLLPGAGDAGAGYAGGNGIGAARGGAGTGTGAGVGASRLTIDSALRWYLLDGDDEVAACRSAGGWCVVESKSAGGPSAADRWLWRAGLRPTRVSKYATGLALMRPDLPAHRWHRTITRTLA